MADNVRDTNSVSAILDRYDRAKSRKQESDGLRQEAGIFGVLGGLNTLVIRVSYKSIS